MDWGNLVDHFGYPTASVIILTYAFIRRRVVPWDTYFEVRTERDIAVAELKKANDENAAELRELRGRLEERQKARSESR